MNVVAYGEGHRDVVMLLHGGGLGPWNYQVQAELLKDRFHVVLPILDGHAGSGRRFTSIEENAEALVRYVEEAFGGQVLCIGGLSLGGQILLEMLSRRKDICRFAVIESALVLPMRATAALLRPALSLSHPLIKKRWFAALQFRSLGIRPPLFEAYYKASAAIDREDMTAFLLANADYKMKPALSDCRASVLVTAGARERSVIKKSAEIIGGAIGNAALELLPGYRHGAFSLNHAEEYTQRLLRLIHC